MNSRKLISVVLKALVYLAAGIVFATIAGIVVYILINGVENLTPELFAPIYTSNNVSALPSLINTVYITLFSLVIAVPLGLFAAIFLVEYSREGNKFVQVIRIATETLAGIPSIVYGLFGMLFFVVSLHWGYSLLAGTLTLAIMVLPLIIRTSEEALLAIPVAFREGSFALGAGKLRTIFTVVLPSAVPGIVAGVVLATGRIIGETAALIFTAGNAQPKVPDSVFDSARTLALHMYDLSQEGLHTGAAYGTAVIILVLVILINAITAFIAKRIVKIG
ncbi:phosphate transport system permease protein PstA [Actinomycetota bacterium]|nr:phosphate transport system permease protein PstA [Actinomycetota bacterium]